MNEISTDETVQGWGAAKEEGKPEPLINQKFTYLDMQKAFQAGRKHMSECGDTHKDCWDFPSWMVGEFK